jgi:four helix bundle protein
MEKPHKKLDAWKLSMDLVIDAYRETEKFPARERYGLLDQIRRAAISIEAILQREQRGRRKRSLQTTFISHKGRSASWIPKLNWQDGSVT